MSVTIKLLFCSSFLAAFISVGAALAAPIHSHGCDTAPEVGLTVCWDAIGGSGEGYAPFAEIYLLPVSQEVRGEVQILEDYTRRIYRQLLPVGMTDNLILQWTPVTHLDEAMTQARRNRWTMVLWIRPRVLRLSSAASPGLLDWDVYAIQSGRLLRTFRIRVESAPRRTDTSKETGVVVASLLAAAGAFSSSPLGATSAVVGSMATAPAHPPEAGHSLTLMTELATRQIPSLFQFSMESIQAYTPPPTGKITDWIDQAVSFR